MSEQKNIFIVWSNTDLTEGRGNPIPIAYCETKSTAIRLSKRQGVQGTDADVQQFPAIKHNGSWCAPITIQHPNDADKKADVAADRKMKIITKAYAAGLTAEDLAELGVRA